MTPAETSALIAAVKKSHWNPEIGMRLFLIDHPHLIGTSEMYALAVGVGRTPFPNIIGLPEGPFPEDKSRPWHDARLWARPEQAEWEKRMAELD